MNVARSLHAKSSVAHVGVVATSGTLNPGETEVSKCTADCDGQTQVDVECHEDEHETEAEPQLDEV